jgi:hypothetical protein
VLGGLQSARLDSGVRVRDAAETETAASNQTGKQLYGCCLLHIIC